jgi:hypothetical protein
VQPQYDQVSVLSSSANKQVRFHPHDGLSENDVTRYLQDQSVETTTRFKGSILRSPKIKASHTSRSITPIEGRRNKSDKN